MTASVFFLNLMNLGVCFVNLMNLCVYGAWLLCMYGVFRSTLKARNLRFRGPRVLKFSMHIHPHMGADIQNFREKFDEKKSSSY